MTKTKKIAIAFATFLVLIMPVFSLAQTTAYQGLIPCGKSADDNTFIDTTRPCDFKDVMTLINTIIKFLLFKMALPIAAIMFAYAGFLMVTSGGSTEARGKAKNIFTSTAFGLIIAVAAWLIIRTILSIIGYDGGWIGF